MDCGVGYNCQQGTKLSPPENLQEKMVSRLTAESPQRSTVPSTKEGVAKIRRHGRWWVGEWTDRQCPALAHLWGHLHRTPASCNQPLGL